MITFFRSAAGRLFNSFRRHDFGVYDLEIYDGWYASQRSNARPHPAEIQLHHTGRGARENSVHRCAHGAAQRGDVTLPQTLPHCKQSAIAKYSVQTDNLPVVMSSFCLFAAHPSHSSPRPSSHFKTGHAQATRLKDSSHVCDLGRPQVPTVLRQRSFNEGA
jgi:hypothetical protein